MDLDLLLDWNTTTVAFKVLVLAAVGAAYVIFEALLSRGESSRRALGSLGDEDNRALVQARAEAFRPISSWSASPGSGD